jgi:equilibrative nucleoside transporter 1/2/3
MTTVFNVMDTVGRKMGGMKMFDLEGRSIKILSIVRVIFIATFLLVAFEIGPAWLFQSTWFKIFNMMAFAFTNGYVSTLCAVKAPGTVPIEQRGQVGAFIGTTITLGILLGSIIAIFMGFVMAAR